MSIIGSIKKGAGAVQSAYNQQKVAAEERVLHKIDNDKVRLEKEKTKLVLELEKVRLQREVSDAKTVIQQEKDIITASKHATGQVPFMEKASGFLIKSAASFSKMQDAYHGTPKRKPISVKRKTTKK